MLCVFCDRKAVEITPCIVAAKTNDMGLIKYIAEKKFNNPYSYASIHKTEYYAFNISKDDIDFEKIV